MSAIGSGITIICGNQLDGFAGSPSPAGVREAMVPVYLGSDDQMTISHFVGRKAWQIIITDDSGNMQSAADFPAVQVLGSRPAPDTIQITNTSSAKRVFVSIRWQEASAEAQLIAVGGLNDEGQRSASSGLVSVSIVNVGQ